MPPVRTSCLALVAILLLPIIPTVSFGSPPDHAPAHGRRSKEAHPTNHPHGSGGLEVVFDAGQGLHIAIGLPGVFFHSGHYYRHTTAGWQVSTTGKEGWRAAIRHSVPDRVRAKHPSPPAKARVKSHPGKKHRPRNKHK